MHDRDKLPNESGGSDAEVTDSTMEKSDDMSPAAVRRELMQRIKNGERSTLASDRRVRKHLCLGFHEQLPGVVPLNLMFFVKSEGYAIRQVFC